MRSRPFCARLDEPARLDLGELRGELVDAHVEVAGDDAAFQRVGDQRRLAALVGVVVRQGDEQGRDALERARVPAAQERLVEERHLALDRGREAGARAGVALGRGIERRARQADERRFHGGLRAGHVAVEIAEADEVAGEGELEDVLAAVGAALEEAERARLDAVDVAAGVAFAEQHFAGVQRAHVAIGATVAEDLGGLEPGNGAVGLDEGEHGGYSGVRCTLHAENMWLHCNDQEVFCRQLKFGLDNV